ncbi:MAG: sugar ABC transporter substrate-binding protein [Chloroflexi bacterium]|nr:sugar ABC transporter substrate-binding protein [Chloroflexota bacterium]
MSTAVNKLTRLAFMRTLPAATLATAAGAACVPGQAQPPAESAKRLAPAELVYTTWWLPPILYGIATEKAAREFEARHPGITVKIEAMTGPANAQLEKIQALIAGGTPPDISLVRPHHMGFFTSRSALVAIDDRLQRTKRVTRGDFFPVTLERLTWQGKMWGLPAEVWFQMTLYNRELFTRAGQPAPAASWTWDRWLEAARRVTGPPDQGAARTFGADQPAWQLLVWAWGGEILNKAETECVLNRAPAPDAIQWRADLTLKHQAAPAPQDLTGVPGGIRGLFEQGRLALHTQANWALSDIEKAAQMPWGVAPIPSGKAGRVTFGGGANYALFQGSKQLDAAWELQADLSIGEGMKTMLAQSSLFPPVRSLAKQELLPSYKPEWLAATLDVAGNARHPHYSHPKFVEIDDIIGQQLAPVWKGERSAQAATDETVRLVNPLLK